MENPIRDRLERVVVTGIGAVTPLGLDVESFWRARIAGQSGIHPIDRFDTSQFRSRVAGQVEDFNATEYMSYREALHIDRYTQLAVCATGQAMVQSGLDTMDHWREDAAVIIGTGQGGILSLAKQIEVLLNTKPRHVSSLLMQMMLPNSAAAFLSIHYGLKGLTYGVSTACASGGTAIARSCDMIRGGKASVVITGGTEAPLLPISQAAFESLRALAENWNESPSAASRPFDKTRKGFVIAEGSAILVLESFRHAQERGAAILAEIKGWGECSDAYHMVVPRENGEGLKRAMDAALRLGKLDPEKVSYINAHATSTPVGDVTEAQAIQSVLGDMVEKVPVSATKSAIGHTLGASAAVGMVETIMALRHQRIPPTLNLNDPDPECKLNHVVKKPLAADISAALVNSAGFGGHNVSLLVTALQN